MARLGKQQLLHEFERAITDSGWNFFHLSRLGEHPGRYQIWHEERSFRVQVYIWNLTHGGGFRRPVDEYRIQITGIRRFEPEIGGKTLILGWWDKVEVFAGFDFVRHSGPLGASPSIQIREATLRDAAVTGFAPQNKGNGELAIAFRPDFLGTYIQHLEDLHASGQFASDVEILEEVAQDPDTVDEPVINERVTEARRYAIVSTRRALREIGFRGRVLTAYGHRCAFCGLQLKLLDAAHILPATHPSSSDITSNGIALCALHHRAYDRALVVFDAEYRTHLNNQTVTELIREGQDGGLKRFRGALRPIIILPPDNRDRPDPQFVSQANRLRGWKT